MPRKKDSSLEKYLQDFADDSHEYKSMLREWAEFEDAWLVFISECYYGLKIDLLVGFLANIIRWVTPK